MQKYQVLPSKRVIDVIPVTADFTSLLRDGDTLESCIVTVTVFSGIDPSVDLLQGGVVLTPTKVTQRIKAGVPGVIYVVLFTAITVDGRTIEIFMRQAVLFGDGEVPDIPLVIFLSSHLYPIDVLESYRGGALPVSGSFIHVVSDYIDASANIFSGALDEILETYSIPWEGYDASSNISSGTLIDVLLTYAYGEFIESDAALQSGTLVKILIVYTNWPVEGYDATAFLQSGSLI